MCVCNFRPDTASYIQKIEREREAQDRGEVKDNRSFLAKYVSDSAGNCFEILIIVFLVDVYCSSCDTYGNIICK